MSKLSKETIKGLVMEVLGERKAVVSEGRVTKADLQRIIKEEYNAMVSEVEDEGGFYAGGMKPFTQASEVPVATDVEQAKIEKIRTTIPAFVNSKKFLDYVSMSQTQDIAAKDLYKQITALRNSIEDKIRKKQPVEEEIKNLERLNIQANRLLPK